MQPLERLISQSPWRGDDAWERHDRAIKRAETFAKFVALACKETFYALGHPAVGSSSLKAI